MMDPFYVMTEYLQTEQAIALQATAAKSAEIKDYIFFEQLIIFLFQPFQCISFILPIFCQPTLCLNKVPT